MIWSRSKANLLRSIWRANRMNRIMRINDFNRRDILYFEARGLVELGERGPVLTDRGLLKLDDASARGRLTLHLLAQNLRVLRASNKTTTSSK